MSSYDKVKPGLGLGPNGHTQMEQAPKSKQIKIDCHTSRDQPAELGKAAFNAKDKVAPVSRIYTNDYSKVQPEKEDRDMVGPALGNPLRW